MICNNFFNLIDRSPKIWKSLDDVISVLYSILERSFRVLKIAMLELVDLYLMILTKITLYSIFKSLFILILISRLFVTPGLSAHINPSLLSIFTGIVDLSSSFYNTISFVISDLKAFVADTLRFQSENERLKSDVEGLLSELKFTKSLYFSEIDSLKSAHNQMIMDKDKLISDKDSIIINLNSQLLSKQSDIGTLNVKNTILSQNSNYMKYFDWFLRCVSLYNAISQPATQFSDIDRAKMNEIQMIVAALASRNAPSVFSTHDAMHSIASINR